MFCLAAEQPHRLLVLDHDGVSGNHALGHASLYRLVARVDASDVRHNVANGHTRVVEGRLCHCVVASPELKLNHGSWLCCDLFRPELEASGICC